MAEHKINIVAAYDQERGIGANNDLLWLRDLPADLARFKRLTTGKSVIMGRKTFESIGRPLPHRQNIVVASTPTGVDGVLSAASLDAALALAQYEPFIIGGERVFSEGLMHADTVHATEVHHTFPQATVFFPPLGAGWAEVEREQHEADERNAYAYDFVTYTRA